MKNTKETYNLFLPLYNYTNSEIELLQEYYKVSMENMSSRRLKVEKEYEIGYKISEIITSIMDKNDYTINPIALKKANETLLFNDVKFKDVVNDISIDKGNKIIKLIFAEQYKHKKIFNPKIARYKYKEVVKHEAILSRSIISDIIVTFESLLTKIFNILILNNPFPYLENETIPLASFFMQDSYPVLTEKIEKIVDKKMYDSIQTFEQIIKTEKIEIDKDVLAAFKEVYYRRNIMVHNDSKVNKQYINSVHTKYRQNLKVGDSILCDQIYLNNALDILYEVLFFLFYGLLKNYSQDNSYVAYIGNVAFEKLKSKEYGIAMILYKTLSKNKNIEFIEKMIYRINYLNAIKQLGHTDILISELKNLDVSIATDKFKIAKLCLCDENDKIYSLLKATYPQSYSATEIKEWPIFINFRETDQYKLFCQEHEEDFSSDEIKTDDVDN